jgi:hypothetical protein
VVELRWPEVGGYAGFRIGESISRGVMELLVRPALFVITVPG